ncbi:MAG: hypothetical protein M1831_001881 [Alyxoria varia]|nr:MAG: hypothetical protein M1831_001881 [Alyxoria varia]
MACMAAEDSTFSLAYDTKEPLYKFLERDPDRQARFFGAMEGIGKDPGHSLDHIVRDYPWAELGIATVGGSSGFMSIGLAKAYPNLAKLVVQDYKYTVEEGAAQLPAELAAEWSFYLTEIVSAIKSESKILLVEVAVMPSNKEDSSIAERYMRHVIRISVLLERFTKANLLHRKVDVSMLQMLNTRERSEAEWRDVVDAVPESPLELTRIFKPQDSWDSIFELSLK